MLIINTGRALRLLYTVILNMICKYSHVYSWLFFFVSFIFGVKYSWIRIWRPQIKTKLSQEMIDKKILTRRLLQKNLLNFFLKQETTEKKIILGQRYVKK